MPDKKNLPRCEVCGHPCGDGSAVFDGRNVCSPKCLIDLLCRICKDATRELRRMRGK